VAGGDGYDVCLPAAVEIFAGPAVGYVEVFVHGFSVMAGEDYEQAPSAKANAC
jgi:hypothetical protein